MTYREYGDRTSFVTATGAISGAEIFFGDIEDEHDRRETSIGNLAKWADDVRGQAVKRGRFFPRRTVADSAWKRLGKGHSAPPAGKGAAPSCETASMSAAVIGWSTMKRYDPAEATPISAPTTSAGTNEPVC